MAIPLTFKGLGVIACRLCGGALRDHDGPYQLRRAGRLGWIGWARWYRAFELNNPCGGKKLSRAVCDEVPEFLQSLQFVLAIAGIAAAVLLAALMLFQAVSGRRVPRLRLVAAGLAVLGVAWGVVCVVGRLFL
jgi:hypothetical protein